MHEIARAWGWWDKGRLAEFYGVKSEDVSPIIKDLVELYHQSRAGAESWYYEQREARNK